MAFYRTSGGGGSSPATNYTSKYSDNDSARSHSSGGSLTKIINLANTNGYMQGTFYVLSATSSSVTLTSSIAHRLRIFEAI